MEQHSLQGAPLLECNLYCTDLVDMFLNTDKYRSSGDSLCFSPRDNRPPTSTSYDNCGTCLPPSRLPVAASFPAESKAAASLLLDCVVMLLLSDLPYTNCATQYVRHAAVKCGINLSSSTQSVLF
ncbi:hypothetical protein XA68_10710 [Ophiocordyceps unilateralis]|uniref:Uncharacterized protein n=1 Tax=Ophiocordyceps unilateralis TaxID=268505 RepID=A0A2A9PNK6_OPHUN|nr:hypothetical protein XA68_10710 [Ophiocordyceps unilateralis]